MGKQTFFRQVRCISRLKPWKIMLIFFRACRSYWGETVRIQDLPSACFSIHVSF